MGTDTGELVFFPRTGGVLHTPVVDNVPTSRGRVKRKRPAKGQQHAGVTTAGLKSRKGALRLDAGAFSGYLSHQS